MPSLALRSIIRPASCALFLALSAPALFAQAAATAPPAGAAATAAPAPPNSYVLSGNLSDADLDRLLAAIRKLKTVELAELNKVPGAIVLHVRGSAQGTILVTAARSAGFELRSMPVRLYAARSLSPQADAAQMRALVEALPGVEQVELEKQASRVALRIRGVPRQDALNAAVRPAGYVLQGVSAYVVSGPTAESDLARLRASLKALPGTDGCETRPVAGGAMLLVYGAPQEQALTAAARNTGYALLPVTDPAENTRSFRVQGVTTPQDADKLRTALNSVGGMGTVQIRITPEETRLGITNGAASLPLVLASAKAAGFTLTPLETVSLPTLDDEAEKITPPAPNERTIEELTKIGELAPDFTLMTHNGTSKISLSDYRGKRPVVLIFGSYT